ncbi:MAG: hypothetical protein VYE00_09495, partial [Candidatus Poribacteria bacterium]|nr:hypothetical protein [Candidatus Poribacteria bacterium]
EKIPLASIGRLLQVFHALPLLFGRHAKNFFLVAFFIFQQSLAQLDISPKRKIRNLLSCGLSQAAILIQRDKLLQVLTENKIKPQRG